MIRECSTLLHVEQLWCVGCVVDSIRAIYFHNAPPHLSVCASSSVMLRFGILYCPQQSPVLLRKSPHLSSSSPVCFFRCALKLLLVVVTYSQCGHLITSPVCFLRCTIRLQPIVVSYSQYGHLSISPLCSTKCHFKWVLLWSHTHNEDILANLSFVVHFGCTVLSFS